MIHDNMYSMLGTNYVTHHGHKDGYIYMNYFYLIDAGENGLYDVENLDHINVKISDAYLPINMNEKYCSQVKSSLIFPMSLFEKNFDDRRLIHMTSGECDFYASIITFELNQIINACKHNVSDFKYDDYQYHFLIYYDNITLDAEINVKNKLLTCKDTRYINLQDLLNRNNYPYNITPAPRTI